MLFWNSKQTPSSSELEQRFMPAEEMSVKINAQEEMNASSQSTSRFTLKAKIAFGVFASMAVAGVTAAATLLSMKSSKSDATHNGTCPANNITGNLSLSHGKHDFYYNASVGNYIPPNMTELAALPCHILLCTSGWAIAQTVEFFKLTQVFINEACSDPNLNISDACGYYTLKKNYTIPECDLPPEKRSCEEVARELMHAEAHRKCELSIFAPDNRGFIIDSENATMNGQPANLSQSGEMTIEDWELKVVK